MIAYSITSFASASRLGGTAIPSAPIAPPPSLPDSPRNERAALAPAELRLPRPAESGCCSTALLASARPWRCRRHGTLGCPPLVTCRVVFRPGRWPGVPSSNDPFGRMSGNRARSAAAWPGGKTRFDARAASSGLRCSGSRCRLQSDGCCHFS
jgi:hypothetical protein